MKISSWLLGAVLSGIGFVNVPGLEPYFICSTVFCVFIAMLIFYVRYGGQGVHDENFRG